MPTSERRELDLRGLRCPRPIFEIAKACQPLSPGTELVVAATDPAFPLDIQSWCRKTHHTLVSLKPTEDGTIAVIRLEAV